MWFLAWRGVLCVFGVFFGSSAYVSSASSYCFYSDNVLVVRADASTLVSHIACMKFLITAPKANLKKKQASTHCGFEVWKPQVQTPSSVCPQTAPLHPGFTGPCRALAHATQYMCQPAWRLTPALTRSGWGTDARLAPAWCNGALQNGRFAWAGAKPCRGEAGV
mgnify:FL=1